MTSADLHEAPRPSARYIGDAATLVRLYAGRPVAEASYDWRG